MIPRQALVFITTSFPIQGDGSEAAGSFVSDLAEELAAQVPIRVVAPGRTSAREQWGRNVEVFRYATPDKPLSTLKPWRPRDLLAIRQVLNFGMEATRSAVSAAPPAALIFALWALPSGHWARRVSAETGVPYSVWTLGSDIWSLGRMPVVRGYLRRVLADARYCFSDGLRLAEDTRIIGGRPVEFLPSSRRIGLARPEPPRESPPYRLVFLGRWHPNKGVDLLLEALGLLDTADWQRIERVDIYGGGPLAPQVEGSVNTLCASGRPVVLHGYVAKAAAEAAIAAADYLLIPSRIESIPVVFSDAIKLDAPVVAMPVGDLPGLVGAGGCGVLAKDLTAPRYADALRQALRTSPGSFQPGLTATREKFDTGAIARTVLDSLAGHHLGMDGWMA